MIRFLFKHELVELESVRPDLTVLDWLRLHRAATGTKEGCGSGDCGACTVVLAELDDSQTGLRYRAVNSCIAFVGAMHGQQLIVVEHLADGTQLHPVQDAMVKQHGSQCGFCTPGFIQSLFALYHAPQEILQSLDDESLGDRELVNRYLGGNLCRCTGYEPIRRAATAVIKARRDGSTDQFDTQQATTIRQLKVLNEVAGTASINTTPADNSDAATPRFLIPESLDQLADWRQRYPDARVLAGGTDLALEVTQQLRDFDSVLYIKRVPELLLCERQNDQLYVGAAVSLERCRLLLSESVSGFDRLMHRFGSEQIRQQATVGGNIANASPIGDLPPVLLALGAVLVLQRGESVRELPIDEFFLEYKQTDLQSGEFIRAVRIPLPAVQTQVAIYKVSKRLDDDISAVCLACALDLDEQARVTSVRLAFGGMAAIPKRASATESALLNDPFTARSVQAARAALAVDFSPISDARAGADYRLRVAGNLLERFRLNLEQPDLITEVLDHDHR